MFCSKPVSGVSISINNVSFQERLIIRYNMPRVLIRVRRRTLTFRATARLIKVVSVDNLEVISPERHRISRNNL